MGIYQLTREGRLTSVPQFVQVDPVRLACVDDVHDRLCIANSRSLLSIYSLDADGLPKGEPQRFDLKATMINDMVVAKNGVLYVACTSPPGGVL
jgi:hypothetical protein